MTLKGTQAEGRAPRFVTEVPPGAVQVHMGKIETAYNPRGSLKKNSLSADLLERLQSDLEFWTDPKYGDSLEEEEAAEKLVAGLRAEVEIAIAEFISGI